MTGDLTVTTGGTTVVADELRAAGERLDRLAIAASSAGARLAALDREASIAWLHSHHAPPEALRTKSEQEHARIALAVVEFQARHLGELVGFVADGYVAAEKVVQAGVGVAEDEIGGLVGLIARAFAVPALAALPRGIPQIAAVVTLLGSMGVRLDLNRLLSTPAAATTARAAVRGSDDALLAAGGVPRPLVTLLGDAGLGLLGGSFSAAVATIASRPWGALRETPVRIESATTLPLRPPVGGFADRLDRIPDPDKLDGAQVIVERYEDERGRPRFEVYISGTVDFAPFATDEPWDTTSNLGNAMGEDSGSVASVRKALADAGVGPNDPVQFTGHSQGGAVGTRIAASGDYNTVGIVTFGAPTGQIEVPSDIPTVFVEHADDIVVGLGGDQTNEHAVVVSRVAAEDVDFDTAEFLPAHRRPAYAETAAMMDDSDDPRITNAAARIAAFTDGSVLVERTAYHCVRVEDSAAAPVVPGHPPTGRAATSSSGGAAGSRSAS